MENYANCDLFDLVFARNSEKRKEKSRDAARCRRGQETEIFYELAHELPISYSLLSQLDKASVIRLSIAHLKLRQLLPNVLKVDDDVPFVSDAVHRLNQQYYKSLDGFLIVMDRKGEVVYVSENIEKYLGLTQVEMLGHNIMDFAHPCDHDDINDMLSDKSGSSAAGMFTDEGLLARQRVLLVRMKCTLTSKGRSINIKSAAYKVIHFSGSVMSPGWMIEPFDLSKSEMSQSSIVLIGRPVLGLATSELPLDSRAFVSRHSMNLQFLYCDNRVAELLGYSPGDLVGKSVYQYHHALDADMLDKAYKALFAKGQSITGLYRFLAKNGGYVWMETHLTLTDLQPDKTRCVVCVNHVVSGVECAEAILADVQLQDHTEILIEEDMEEVTCYNGDEEEVISGVAEEEGMQFVTEKFLAIKTSSRVDRGHTELEMSRDIVDRSPMLSAGNPQIIVKPCRVEEHKPIGLSRPIHRISSNSSIGNIFDDLDANMEMRAPYIPIDDDLVFGTVTSTAVLSDDAAMDSSPVDLSTCTSSMSTSTAYEIDDVHSLFTSLHNTVVDTDQTHLIDSTVVTSTKRPLVDHQVLNLVIPPAYKVIKLSTEPVTITSSPPTLIPVPTPAPAVRKPAQTSSVLLNLLTTGEDTNFGYRLFPNAAAESSGNGNRNVTPTVLLLHQLLQPEFAPGINCTPSTTSNESLLSTLRRTTTST